jgi:hypothetical protein
MIWITYPISGQDIFLKCGLLLMLIPLLAFEKERNAAVGSHSTVCGLPETRKWLFGQCMLLIISDSKSEVLISHFWWKDKKSPKNTLSVAIFCTSVESGETFGTSAPPSDWRQKPKKVE